MLLYDAWYASISRFTLDGAGTAKTAIEHGPKFATANECTDMIFKDVDFGIEAGSAAGIAETAVLRCRFFRCARAAISIQDFNSLDWYIWDCWFEDCGIGVTNEFKAGNVHIYQSTFLRSKDADITIRNTGYFSFQGNTSIGSRRFFHAKRAKAWKDSETWGSQATLQDNLVLDPTDPTPVVIENNGPNMILDNTCRVAGDGPLVVSAPPSEKADLIVIGNTWTIARPIEVRGRLTELDNKTVAANTIADAKPVPVPFAESASRTVIEVAAGADAAAIQAAIDQAATMKGKRPVVHLPKGNYTVNKTLIIPAGCDLQLVGDGPENATQLIGSGIDPVIRVQGPSQATLRSFLVNGGNGAVGILAENCDQPGGRVFGEQLNVSGFEYGFVSHGLEHSQVELRDAGHNGMQVVGGGPGTKPWGALFSGASSRLMNLTGSGEFAYHCGFVAPADPNHLDKSVDWERDVRKSVAALQFDGFKGKLAFTLVSSNGGNLRVVPPSAGTKLYLLGFLTYDGRIDFGGDATKGQVVAEHVKAFRKDRHPDHPNQSTGLDSIDGIGKASPEFIREMLVPLRTVKPQPLVNAGRDASDLRFYRVWANGKTGVRLQATP
jgi:hypothetical protein